MVGQVKPNQIKHKREEKSITVVTSQGQNEVFLIVEENYVNLALMIVLELLTQVPPSMSLHVKSIFHLTKMVILVLLRWETKCQAKLLV